MGYYIQTDGIKNKATEIANQHSGLVLDHVPESFDSVPSNMAIICVVDNGHFEAAAFCYSKEEFEVFMTPDGRPKTWMLMNRDKAEELTGF